jgi:hypothetical protein
MLMLSGGLVLVPIDAFDRLRSSITRMAIGSSEGVPELSDGSPIAKERDRAS